MNSRNNILKSNDVTVKSTPISSRTPLITVLMRHQRVAVDATADGALTKPSIKQKSADATMGSSTPKRSKNECEFTLMSFNDVEQSVKWNWFRCRGPKVTSGAMCDKWLMAMQALVRGHFNRRAPANWHHVYLDVGYYILLDEYSREPRKLGEMSKSLKHIEI